MFMTLGMVIVVAAWLFWDYTADSASEYLGETHEQWFL